MAGVIAADTMDFAAYMAQTEAQQKVRPASEWVQEMIENLGKRQREIKAFLPWDKTHPYFAFRPGEVTLWAGVNGHGKSMVTGMAMLSLISQGERVCLASFEMKPHRTLERMSRQFSGQRPPAEWETNSAVLELFRQVYDDFRIFTDGRMWLYDQQGTVNSATVLGVIKYAAVELRCQHFVVDSLRKCVKGEEGYNGQKEFVDALTCVARDFGIHIHLVHHIRKLGSEADTPDKSDVKGSGSITDQVDNLLLVWRNKRKEKDVQAGKKVSAEDPDAMLICDKQRNGEWEGRFTLWFDAESQQYLPHEGAKKLDFCTWPHRGQP